MSKIIPTFREAIIFPHDLWKPLHKGEHLLGQGLFLLIKALYFISKKALRTMAKISSQNSYELDAISSFVCLTGFNLYVGNSVAFERRGKRQCDPWLAGKRSPVTRWGQIFFSRLLDHMGDFNNQSGTQIVLKHILVYFSIFKNISFLRIATIRQEAKLFLSSICHSQASKVLIIW